MKLSLGISIMATLLTIAPRVGRAATGCTLNDPDRDIVRIFKDATNYRTTFISIAEGGGGTLREVLERRLGDRLDPIYEADDVPYAYYTVLNGETVIGHVHGVNQKGMFGGMQLILATDTTGTIVAFYYQKLSSPEARKFRDDAFRQQFVGLSLAEFTLHAQVTGEGRAETRVGRIIDPSKRSRADFEATLRGLHKNLILLKLLYLGEREQKEGAP